MGGVPEHLIILTLAAESVEKHGANVEFVIKKCGTGAMIEAVERRIDVRGAYGRSVADASKGSDVRLLGTYVASPLCWARRRCLSSVQFHR